MDTVGPRDGEAVATFRNGRLRLTDRRLHYTGRGRRPRDAFEMRLSALTAVGLKRVFGPYQLAVLASSLLLAPALLVGLATQDDVVFINAFLLSMVLLPLLMTIAWLAVPGHAIRIDASGVRLHVPVRRARLDEAIAFVRRTSAATMQPSEGDVPTHHPKTPKAAQE